MTMDKSFSSHKTINPLIFSYYYKRLCCIQSSVHNCIRIIKKSAFYYTTKFKHICYLPHGTLNLHLRRINA